MDKSGYYFPSGDFMSMDVDNLLGMSFHGGFHTGLIFQSHKKGLAKGIVGACITII